MNPMQDSDFMGQMASFSSLEQITNLAAANEKIASSLSSTNAVGLIGRTVTYGRERRGPHRRRREGHHAAASRPLPWTASMVSTRNHHAGRLGDKGVDAPMMRGMFAAISGLKTHQVMLDVTSNDIANVNTIGYKSARTTFADSLTQTQRGASGPGGGVGGSNAAQVGLGVQLGSIDNLMTGGTMQSTGNPTDVAIQQGPGFFRVAASPTTPPTANPAAVEYTRAGNFTTSQTGYLMTQDGYYVQGRTAGGADSLIQLPAGATNMQIGSTARSATWTPPTPAQSAGFLSLATFANPRA